MITTLLVWMLIVAKTIGLLAASWNWICGPCTALCTALAPMLGGLMGSSGLGGL